MNVFLSCPKCKKSLEMDAAPAGSQAECPDCGQWFIVGEAGARLPVVQPQAVDAPVAKRKGPPPGRPAVSSRPAGEAHELKHGIEAEARGKFVTGTMPAGARSQRRKCAECDSAMAISHGESHVLDFLLPLGSTVFWVCERCGKEIKLQSPWRLFLIVMASPLIVGWWVVFSESSRHHDVNAVWWKRAVEDFAPKDSKGSFWYILFLLLFALAPLALIRELIVRLRHPRIL